MRVIATIVASLWAWGFAGVALAEGPDEHLRSLAWLVGTWEGSGKYGNDEFTDSATYEWTHNQHFIKWSSEARMGGQVVHSETGMLGWDEAKGRLVWFSFTMDGTIGQSEDQASEEKDTWVSTGNVGNTPPWNDTRQVMRKVDDDTFTIEVQSKSESEYVTFFQGTYKRKE